MWQRIWRGLGAAARRRKRDEEMREEIGFHLEMETAENVRKGMAPEEAHSTALRQFGGLDQVEEEHRDARGSRFLETVGQDLRYGLRSLRRNPAFASVVILALGLGIGANTAIFSVVHGVLLQSLPYGGGERLVRIRQDAPGAGVEDSPFSIPEFEDYRDQNATLEGTVEYHTMWFVLLGRKEPERVQTGVVSWNFFDLLGVRPGLGRSFQPGDERPAADAVLVLSHAFWQRSFGGDPAILGRVFRMNDRPHTVIGILPPIPGYPDENDVYMPTTACPFRSRPELIAARSGRMVTLFGRLKKGVSLEVARADLQTISGRLARQYPETYPPGSGYAATALSLQEELTRGARPTLLILLAAVLLVLLIACANVANLTLARLIRREREMALRATLGAGRARLVRQLLTESTVLALVGGALGLLLAWGGMGLLVRFAARFTPRAQEISIDGTVLLFTLVVSVASGLAFGLLPALSRRRDLAAAIQDSGERATAGLGRHRVRSILIVAQVAISFMLLIGAGLMVRSLWKLQGVDPGFRTERVLTMRLDLNFTKYTSSQDYRSFHERLLERVEKQPGVVSAALAGTFPLNEGLPSLGRFQIEGRPPADPTLLPQADFQFVSTEYFRTLGIPLLRGRFFTRLDRPGGEDVLVINHRMARHYWGDEDPVGKRLTTDQGQTWSTIVGVVGDVRQYGLDRSPSDQIYAALLQNPTLSSTFLIRTAAPPQTVALLAREAVATIDPDQPVDRFRTIEQVRQESLASPRLTARLLLLFAALALTITAAGIAGVVAFSVSQRRHEFGIRMALGARPNNVLGLVLRQGLGLVAAGLALGLLGSLGLSRLLSSLLFQIEPHDPATFAAVSFLLFGVAAAACLIPARRATTVDPMVALRAS